MKDKNEMNADKAIGMVINEYGEIIRTNGEDIQFSAPIFTPPQENVKPQTQDDISISFRTVREPEGKNKSDKVVSGVSNVELDNLKKELGIER